MNITVTGRHVEVTDALRQHVEEKIRKAFEDFPRVQKVRVILNVERHRHSAEIVVQGWHHHHHAEGREETHDMYLSVDGAIEKVLKQMRRWADRVHEHRAVGLGRLESSRPSEEAAGD